MECNHRRHPGTFRVSATSEIALPPQTVLKVSARVEKSVPHYRGDNEFSILAGGTFTFKTVSPTTKDLFYFVAIGGNIHSHLSNIRSGSRFLTPR